MVPKLRAPLAVAIASTLVAVAPAAAGTTTTEAQPAAKTAPVEVRAHGFAREKQTALVLPRRRFVVRGTVRRFVRGEQVEVRVVRRGSRILERTVPLRRGAKGMGRFVARFRARGPAKLAVRTALTERGLKGERQPLRVVDPSPSAGARGPLVSFVQRRLTRLGYATSRSGRLDRRTEHAIFAYRKANGLSRTSFTTNERILARLARRKGAFRPRYPGHGKHVEADLSRQVLALVEKGRPYRVYHMSSGKRSTPTILGSFRFYRKDRGFNSSRMLHSNYFIRGYAVHGYRFVPPYPDSHGCLRIPNSDALFVFGWIDHGDRIDVYR